MTYKSGKARSLLLAGLREARVSRPPEPTDRRTKEERQLTRTGYKRLICYLHPLEYRELSELATEEGASLSVALRGCLRAIVTVPKE